MGWAIAADGTTHLLHLAVGTTESEVCWTAFFRSLRSRGLRLPTTVTSDGAPAWSSAKRVGPFRGVWTTISAQADTAIAGRLRVVVTAWAGSVSHLCPAWSDDRATHCERARPARGGQSWS